MSRGRRIAWLAAALSGGAALAAAAASLAPLHPLDWAAVARPAAGAVTALALEPGSARLAVGDERGVLLGRPGRPLARVLQRGPVRDLAFLDDGSLLAATARGLYRIEADRSAPLAPAPGSAARAANRVAALPGLVALATDAGIFVSRDTRSWRRLGGLPGGAAGAVALRRRGGGFRCYAVIAGAVWRVDVRERSGGLVAGPPARETIPAAIRGGGAVDLATGLPGAAVAVVFPRALALREQDVPGSAWRVTQPQLPPGARAQRLGAGAGRVWLATDRGLLVAPDLAGPWRRAAAPIGSAPVGAAVGDADALYVGFRDDLRVGREAPAAAPAGGPPPPVPGDPPVARVQQAALAYLRLEPARIEALRRGVRRRGWWPVVGLRGGAAWSRDRSHDADETFVSGATRRLFDRERDRDDDYDVTLSLSWDLGAVAYDPESIDVSKEARELIELRDDVLDEVTQLYFERRRAVAALAAGGDAADAALLRLRTEELAAGIDAWTGGWFSRQIVPLAP